MNGPKKVRSLEKDELCTEVVKNSTRLNLFGVVGGILLLPTVSGLIYLSSFAGEIKQNDKEIAEIKIEDAEMEKRQDTVEKAIVRIDTHMEAQTILLQKVAEKVGAQ